MAEVVVRFWAGAQRAAGVSEELLSASTVGELRAFLMARPGLTQICEAATFLVDEVGAADDTRLNSGSVVDVLPPFAGG